MIALWLSKGPLPFRSTFRLPPPPGGPAVRRFRLWFTGLLLGSLFCLSAQTHFTIPQSVWRIKITAGTRSGNWIGARGKRGLLNQEYVLEGYGKRYFDHEYVSSNGYFSSPSDFYDLDTLYISATQTIGQVIGDFNRLYPSQLGLDSLLDYRQDFFGPQSVTIGGLLDQFERRSTTFRELRLEYGMSNRLTFRLVVPYISSLEQETSWRWQAMQVTGLSDFIAYHQQAQTGLEGLFADPAYSAVSTTTRDYLEKIYRRFYTWDGDQTLLWALKGGTDPLGQGVYGREYNPFADSDTSAVTLDSLLAFYHPSRRSSSGVGDVELGLNLLLLGRPAWSGKGIYSVYGGLRVRLPSATRLSRYNPAKRDPQGRPRQFAELPLGTGLSKWTLLLFGELYKLIYRRLVNITWDAQVGFYSQELINTPLSFRGVTPITHPDSIAALVGDQVLFKQGTDFRGSLAGKLEVWPERVFVEAGLEGYFTWRDSYYSRYRAWDQWMRIRGRGKVYDTRKSAFRQWVVLIFNNVDPFKKLGPLAFDLELGLRWSLPTLTRHDFDTAAVWFGLSSYFQGW